MTDYKIVICAWPQNNVDEKSIIPTQCCQWKLQKMFERLGQNTHKLTKILTFSKYRELLKILILFKNTVLEVPLDCKIIYCRIGGISWYTVEFTKIVQNLTVRNQILPLTLIRSDHNYKWRLLRVKTKSKVLMNWHMYMSCNPIGKK